MWKYLREFLSDRRIIELTRLIWYPILYGIILMVRPGKSESYIKVFGIKKMTSHHLKYLQEMFQKNCKKNIKRKK